MEKSGISIIVPIYNAEAYLRECLDSLLNQTFKDFELICVNDASDDMSAEILKEYTKLDDRIISLTNNYRQGAAEARNRGMKVAKGTYLAFLDADDVFDNKMLELAFNAIEKGHADVVMFEFMHMPTERIYDVVKKTHIREYKAKYCRNYFYLKDYPPYEILRWTSAPWNKLYRRSFIEEQCLTFQTLSCSNDVYFVNMALMSRSKLIVLDEEKILVHVRDHNSSTRISNDRDPMCCYYALEKIQVELIKRGLFEDMFAHFYYRALMELLSAIKKANCSKRKQFYNFLTQKGVKELCQRGGEYYVRNDQYIKNTFKKFKDNSFESQWFIQEGYLNIFLKKNKISFINFIRDNLLMGREVCIWGAGFNGRILVDFFWANGLMVSSVLDMDKNKEGTYIGKHRIGLPSTLLNKTDKKYLVIVSSIAAIESANKLRQESENDIVIADIYAVL